MLIWGKTILISKFQVVGLASLMDAQSSGELQLAHGVNDTVESWLQAGVNLVVENFRLLCKSHANGSLIILVIIPE